MLSFKPGAAKTIYLFRIDLNYKIAHKFNRRTNELEGCRLGLPASFIFVRSLP
jgi:hypothetical protein